mgnify:CR=1 FL=1
MKILDVEKIEIRFEKQLNLETFNWCIYCKTEKGNTVRLWDLVRQRIKKFTFSARKTDRKDMEEILGCSRIFFLLFIESQFYSHPITKEKMSWNNSKKWHIDHITPLAVLDPKNDKHFAIANHFINLRPMWAEENLSKGSKVIKGYGISYLMKKYHMFKYIVDLKEIKNKSIAQTRLDELIKKKLV